MGVLESKAKRRASRFSTSQSDKESAYGPSTEVDKHVYFVLLFLCWVFQLRPQITTSRVRILNRSQVLRKAK